MSSSSTPASTTGFDQFELHDALVDGIRAAGFKTPRPIQLDTLPAGCEGRDVLGLAQTGTGKTAAFALPLLDRFHSRRRPGPRALILAPTRELATQISQEIRTLAQFTRVKTVTIYGGVPLQGQLRVLSQRPEIVVGCPGRVLDLLRQGKLHLDKVEALVLDEADHMFDMGFLPDIRCIIDALPARRQNLLFAATMPRQVRRLADRLLSEPHVVELASSAPAETVDHALILVEETQKRALLSHVLGRDDCESAIIFTRTKFRARRLAEQLTRAGHHAVGLQGNMSQGQRDRAMEGFRRRRYHILVATDIAARGIDVSGVSHVINFDVPSTPEGYTHRIGRTGRADLEGTAWTFVTRSDGQWVRATERMIGAPIPRRQVEGFDGGSEEWARLRSRTHGQGSRDQSGQPRRSSPHRGRSRRRIRCR
jgi:ATP-dependent RNA helicase RhlE